ncbi:MAG TPA: glutamate racemase [Beutenbergiaceae bacterium]|nr:glutamate racemase [Beutenbergiaceae bacterium]
MSGAPIGIFDSGVGGLTVARAVIDQLPSESILYVGDTANAPYGSKPLPQVRRHAAAIMDRLVETGVKVLVVACNSASAALGQELRDRYQNDHGIPVIEVIQPAVRSAIAATRTGKIGVLATQATVDSGAYQAAFGQNSACTELTIGAAPRFVEFVERGITSGPEVLQAAKEYLAPMKQANVDTLVLGCTHYPLLTGVISYVMGDDVILVSSAEETAKDVFHTILDTGLAADEDASPTYSFLATGDPEAFTRLAHRFLGPEVGAQPASTVTGEIPVIPAQEAP